MMHKNNDIFENLVLFDDGKESDEERYTHETMANRRKDNVYSINEAWPRFLCHS